ncbi:VPS37 C-terminal domain-containing protein [Aphelenchoides bicaudatus]|nr:VPS37 C-terminal domain-containing protein [Aphelenchoides bicaudatus]
MASAYESTVDMCVSSLMSQVRTYNEDQLQTLLNDDSRIESMVNSLPQLLTVNSDRDNRMAMLKSMADSNLSMEPKFKELRDKLKMTCKEFQLLVDEVKQLEAETKLNEGENNLDTVSALLQAATQKTEDEGELLTEQLYEGSLPIDAFVKDFHNKRALYHTRKVKVDKINEHLRNQQFRPVSEPIYPASSNGISTSWSERLSQCKRNRQDIPIITSLIRVSPCTLFKLRKCHTSRSLLENATAKVF